MHETAGTHAGTGAVAETRVGYPRPWLYDYTHDQMRMSARRVSLEKRIHLTKAGTNLLYRRLTPWKVPVEENDLEEAF